MSEELNDSGNDRLKALEASQGKLVLAFHIVLLGTILASGSLMVVMWRQSSVTFKAIEKNRKLVDAYQANEAPRANAFIARMVEYSKTHPEFAPILQNYSTGGTTLAAPTGGGGSGGLPALPTNE